MEKGLKEKLLESGREEEESLGKKIWSESKRLWIVAGPAIFTRFSTFGVTVISQAFIGHIGATELAAFALVHTVLLRFANGILATGYGSQRRPKKKLFFESMQSLYPTLTAVMLGPAYFTIGF